MKFRVCNDLVFSQPLQGPLSAHIAEYAQWEREQGYSLSRLRKRVELAASFSRWLGQKNIDSCCISIGHIPCYLRSRKLRVKIYESDGTALKQFIGFLRRRNIVSEEDVPPGQPSYVDRTIHEFRAYLLNQRALAQRTIEDYAPFARTFLVHCFGKSPVRLSKLCAGDIVEFVQCEAQKLHRKRAKLMTSALRSFLHYACYRGEVRHDLVAAVPAVANWSMTSIPRAISPDLVRQLLNSINRHTAVGRRDYAIILLLARLGLRASEIVGLKLEDIDWNHGILYLRRKGGQHGTLPLPADVGTAIAAYLRHGRSPNSKCRSVFLRVRAPLGGFHNHCAISSLVRNHLRCTGIKTPTQGAHQFRHGLATDMLRHGASLSEIGEVLGHHSPESTKIYTKVDLDALRPLALPWPGGVR